jgi:hypothetical protein
VWPYVAWGALTVLQYGLGYVLLAKISGPMAMFNAVNYVNASAGLRMLATAVDHVIVYALCCACWIKWGAMGLPANSQTSA